jgi:hypothetical protein
MSTTLPFPRAQRPATPAGLDPAPLPGRTVRPLPETGPDLPVQAFVDVMSTARAFYETGLGNGETTHWPCLDEHWTWLRKEITAITGYANQGKSRFILSVMLMKAAVSGWRFCVYVPENEEEFYVEMAEMLVGRTANLKFPQHRMAWNQLETAIEWLYQHFTVVTAPEGATPAQLLDTFTLQAAQRKYDAVLIDPWNQLTHDFQSREDLYLSQQFSLLKRYAIRHDVAVLVTAHPAGDVKSKEGKLLVPNAYSISGGKMWANKFDNVMAVFRPAFPEPEVQFWIHKIKKQGRVGRPGMLELKYDVRTNRYAPEIGDKRNPLEGTVWDTAGQMVLPAPVPYERLPLPASQFDTAPWEPAPVPYAVAAAHRPDSPLGVPGIKFGPQATL